ncbi:prepilin peptidase [Candidatus Saccharibacteria bacterium]|nr:prepilin peptidase [Candidatus Saccharibacteria bacterium]
MEPYFRILVLIILFFLGAILGSFACCQAWRIRLKEQKQKSPGKWSVCLSCGKRLSKAENIPILSWLFQKGKCKKCGAKIGLAEILSELSFAIALPVIGNSLYDQFVTAIGASDVPDLAMLILISLVLIISMSVMWILLVYDAKWQGLPTFLLTILNACAIMYVILSVIGLILDGTTFPEIGVYLLKTAGSAAILAAPYYLLSTLSKEKLVGSGDWLIALPVALILGNWWLGLVALFIANALGSIFGIIYKAKSGKRQIPFGPFLILAFVIVYSLQSWLLSLIVIV